MHWTTTILPNTTAGYEKRCDRAHAALEVAVPSSALKFAGTYLYKRKARMFDFIVHDEITKVANATVQTSPRHSAMATERNEDPRKHHRLRPLTSHR